ncbi:hypothetical protein OBBRIDRAFT_787488 [Obba rivulosa]|uniref:SH3 domain-binding glutamic acid-rich protein n=1 Tax=Obba rivulosa TaxID=1052685 RepID=A0A8E2J6X3_9APHY|nr:hypothetical protein OBBRIDRAFT_787488 [Obba rivulosa]
MAPPPIQLFLTTIASQPALRQRQEYILRVLQVKKIQFTSYDLASDEDAKKLWRRKTPLDKQQLPGILVGGTFPGTFADFEEAVECDTLDEFLHLNEDYLPFEDERELLFANPVGVAGAYTPAQMNPEHSPSPSPLKSKPKPKDEKEIDVGAELDDAGLQGVSVSEDDLLALVEELGLGGEEASDLVKGLTGDKTPPRKEKDKPLVDTKPATPQTTAAEKHEEQPAPAGDKADEKETP